MSKRGEINGWRCDRCELITYAIHVDDGVTPMFLACRATGKLEGCEGMGTSLMYPPPPVPDHVLAETRWEWYKPEPPKRRFDITTGKFFTPLDSLTPAARQHVEQGGLLLRELTDAGRELLGAHDAQ
jgi:hypothetical protein